MKKAPTATCHYTLPLPVTLNTLSPGSILYADIVNFTPLSEQLSAPALVTTLNDLFGRFDQVAQVGGRGVRWIEAMQNWLQHLNYLLY